MASICLGLNVLTLLVLQTSTAHLTKYAHGFVVLCFVAIILSSASGYYDIKNNVWVTVNNDFWVMSEEICQRFSWATKSRVKIIGKKNHWSLISQLSPRTVVSDLPLWRHHSGSVMSREREILALWRDICRLFLQVQIGTKANFTSE